MVAPTRRFTADPLPDEVLYRILEHARFAPNGGNRQAWHVIVVRDPGPGFDVSKIPDPCVGENIFSSHGAKRAKSLSRRASTQFCWAWTLTRANSSTNDFGKRVRCE